MLDWYRGSRPCVYMTRPLYPSNQSQSIRSRRWLPDSAVEGRVARVGMLVQPLPTERLA